MPTMKIERTPQDLAAELAGLSHVDWPAIWAGPPNPGQPLDDWCALFGWRPTSFERVLSVRTPTGEKLYLYPVRSGGWSPVGNLSWSTWHLSADTQEENEAVLERGAEVWPAYEAAARGVLGTPEFSGAWDDPAFPEPQHDEHWLLPKDIRLEDRNPYRMAMWRDPSPEGPLTVMELYSGGVTNRGIGKRGVMINVDFYPQEIM